MTPRQSAERHLPGLAEVHDLCKATFGASLVHLVTPDGEWGQRPEYLEWPMVRGDEFARESWPPPATRTTKSK